MPTTGALRLTRNLVFTVLAIGALPVQAQDYLQDYNEERIKPERIPEEVRKTAESVTPKANYNQTFDGDYFYRFVGPTDDGRFVETMVSDDGRLGSIRLRTPVKPTALPRAVSAAFEAQRAKDELLKGFQPTRVEKVETRKEVNSQPDVAYEYEGRNAEKVWVRCVIEESGQVRKLDFLLVHPDMKRHRQERNLANLPAAVKQAAVAAAPGYRFTQAFEDNPEDGFPSLMLKGVNARGQAVELDLDPKNGRLNSAAFDISSRQVPASVVSVYRGHARTDEELKGFQIVRTVRLDLPALGDVAYVLYGRDAEGEAQEVRIGPGPDIFSVLPTSAENLESAAADAEKLPAPGSDVLNIEYAYWGYGLRWDDVTELVRSKVDDGRLTLTANVETLTSPPVDSARTLVVAFSVGKRFDLATAVENQEMQLPPPNFEGQTVVAHGLQILKATTGVDTRWADATAKARTQVQGDRLELEPLKFEWPDPAYGVYKTKTVLYAHEGKVGLYVGGDSVPISIPPKPSEPPTLALPVSRPLKTFEGDKEAFYHVQFLPDGRQLLGSGQGPVRLWDVETGRELRLFRSPGGKPTTFSLAANGRAMITWANDQQLRLWNVKTGQELRAYPQEGSVSELTLSRDGRLAGVATYDRVARVVDLASGRELATLEGHTDAVTGLVFSPDARRIYTCSWDGSAKVWEVSSGKRLRSLEAHRGATGDLDLSRDGKTLLTGTNGGAMTVWDVASDGEPRTLEPQVDVGWALAISPDGRRALSAEVNAFVLWDLDSGRAVRRFEGHTDQITDLAFSPDGLQAASAGREGTVKLWEIPRRGR